MVSVQLMLANTFRQLSQVISVCPFRAGISHVLHDEPNRAKNSIAVISPTAQTSCQEYEAADCSLIILSISSPNGWNSNDARPIRARRFRSGGE